MGRELIAFTQRGRASLTAMLPRFNSVANVVCTVCSAWLQRRTVRRVRESGSAEGNTAARTPGTAPEGLSVFSYSLVGCV